MNPRLSAGYSSFPRSRESRVARLRRLLPVHARGRSWTPSLLTLGLALAVVNGGARAQETVTFEGGTVAKSFPVEMVYAEPGAPSIKLENSRMTVVGDVTDKKFGVSYRGTLVSNTQFTGEEKASLYLYPSCDNKPPGETQDPVVGKATLGPLTAGKNRSTIITMVETTALVPLDEVKCGKISVVCPDCASFKPEEYLTKRLPVADRADLSAIDITNMSVVMLGGSSSNTFSVSYRGTLAPKSEMEGKEKVVVYLYSDACDGKNAAQTGSFSVGTATIGVVPAGHARSTMIATVDAKVAVPLSEIKCGRVAVECPACQSAGPEGLVTLPLPLADNKSLTSVKAEDMLLGMYGLASAKTFDISYRGTLVPGSPVTGKEKLVLYLYDKACDDKDPTQTTALSVGSVSIGSVPFGVERAAFISTAEATAIVPMSEVKCGKLAVVCRQCGPAGQPPGKDYMVNTMTLPDQTTDDVRLSKMSISLVGEPNSNSFGVSFRGTAELRRNASDEDMLVARLYMQCDGSGPQNTAGTNVGTIDLHSFKDGRKSVDLVTTTQGGAFVPLKDIQCVKIDLQY